MGEGPHDQSSGVPWGNLFRAAIVRSLAKRGVAMSDDKHCTRGAAADGGGAGVVGHMDIEGTRAVERGLGQPGSGGAPTAGSAGVARGLGRGSGGAETGGSPEGPQAGTKAHSGAARAGMGRGCGGIQEGPGEGSSSKERHLETEQGNEGGVDGARHDRTYQGSGLRTRLGSAGKMCRFF